MLVEDGKDRVMGEMRQQQEQEEHQFMDELELCQRIARGQTTIEDAFYVARALKVHYDSKEDNHAKE